MPEGIGKLGGGDEMLDHENALEVRTKVSVL